MTPTASKPLNPRQADFLAALLTSPSVKAAAAKVGVTDRTCYKWMAADATFKEAFREAKARAVDQAAAILAHTAVTAIDVLIAVAGNPALPANARVSAAGKLLDTLLRVQEMDEVVGRLERVEAVLALTRPVGGSSL